MKTLLVIRHAKSSWKDTSLSDFDRPLNKRGNRDAPMMAKALRSHAIKPDLILCSPAKRTTLTAEILAGSVGYDPKEIVYDPTLYLADTYTMLHAIHNVDNRISNLYLIGHNPGATELVNLLSNCDIDNLPTCGIFAITFETDNWKKVAADSGEMLFFDYPKRYLQT